VELQAISGNMTVQLTMSLLENVPKLQDTWQVILKKLNLLAVAAQSKKNNGKLFKRSWLKKTLFKTSLM
jgi:hypothetical protein